MVIYSCVTDLHDELECRFHWNTRKCYWWRTDIYSERENPVLYTKTLKSYKNKALKCEIWKRIGEMLDCIN